MAKVKKAVFFSIVSILLVILFVASSGVTSQVSIGESQIDVTRTRVKILNSLVKDVENEYFESIIYMATKNSLIGISKYYYDNDYSDSVMKKQLNYALVDVIYDGVLNDADGNFQENLSKDGYVNHAYTINGLMYNISLLLNKMDVSVKELTINISKNSITQTDPWDVQIQADIHYYFVDNNNLASWNGYLSKTVTVPVYGIYLYDRENGPSVISNKGIVNSSWKVDNGTASEAPVISKLGKYGPYSQRGICKSYCIIQ
jgi:hypothetical protein